MAWSPDGPGGIHAGCGSISRMALAGIWLTLLDASRKRLRDVDDASMMELIRDMFMSKLDSDLDGRAERRRDSRCCELRAPL